MMIVRHKGRKINIPVRRTGFFRRGTGLTFRTRNTDNLLFDFDESVDPGSIFAAVTSWFVFFPFLILWLDEDNTVVEKKIVRPFSLSFRPSRPFRKFVEVPFNEKNRQILTFFDEKRRKV